MELLKIANEIWWNLKAFQKFNTHFHAIMMTSHQHHGIPNHWTFDCIFNGLVGLGGGGGGGGGRSTGDQVDSPHKGPVMWKAFPFHDILQEDSQPNHFL